MNKLINWFTTALMIYLVFCGESLDLPRLFALTGLLSVMMWMVWKIQDEIKAHNLNQFNVDDAPIATEIARAQKVNIHA